MKNLVIVFIFSLFANFSFSQVNVGFAKAANLDEGRSFYSVNEAIDRFVDGMNSPLLGQIYMLSISQCFKNAGMQYGGRQISDTAVLETLGWLKSHPKDMGKYAFSVYMLKEGEVYTFQTLTYENGVWVDGKQVQRRAHKGEYVLECLGQKVASSWCLNLFPSVGVVQKTKPAPKAEPEHNYEPAPEVDSDYGYDDAALAETGKGNIINITNIYNDSPKNSSRRNERSDRGFTQLGDDYSESVYRICGHCGIRLHKYDMQRHIRYDCFKRQNRSCGSGGFINPTFRLVVGGGSSHRHSKYCKH